MKLQIDTEAKTVRLEGKENLKSFFDAIKRLLPGDLWESYSFELNAVINWYTTPPIVYSWPSIKPYDVWYCSNGGTSTYCFEIK